MLDNVAWLVLSPLANVIGLIMDSVFLRGEVNLLSIFKKWLSNDMKGGSSIPLSVVWAV